jgi:hypothetical protein
MRQAVRSLAGAFSFVIFISASARAQTAPARSWQFELLPRFDFLLSSNVLSGNDPRFAWDTHWAGELDFVDYSYGRLTLFADYQAIVGHDRRPFDPYQSNYSLEAFASLRQGSSELALVFHHVSRHLGDRPMPGAVAWNTALWRILRRIERGGSTVDLMGEFGPVVARVGVDYTWTGTIDAAARRPISQRFELYGRGAGVTFGVDDEVAGRGRQWGGRFEAGVRFTARAAALDLFGGFERMIDADPLEMAPRTWALAGFRLTGM